MVGAILPQACQTLFPGPSSALGGEWDRDHLKEEATDPGKETSRARLAGGGLTW